MQGNNLFPYGALYACCLTIMVFKLFPDIDIVFSSFFYANDAFVMKGTALYLINKAVPLVALAPILIVPLYILWHNLYKKTKFISNSQCLYLLFVAVIGVVLFAHIVIKVYFARCRPYMIHTFGGYNNFSPILSIGECRKEASFISSHAACGFALYSGMFLPQFKKYKLHIFCLSTILGCVFGMLRIIEGSHFLSDVIFSGYFMYFFAYFAYITLNSSFFQRILLAR